jgi:2-hydroxychromene-2-carboxylate isomerase
MNDLLFELAGNQKEMNFNMLGAKTGLDSKEMARAIFSQKMQQILKIDIWTALKHRMVGTPSYLIDGKVYQGQLPPGILEKLIG